MVGKPQGNRPLGRHKCKWEDNIKIDLQEIEWGEMGNGLIRLRIGSNGGYL
jgi:hypothetical protein